MCNTFHRSRIQPAAVPDAESTNHVLIRDVEMNRDEVSQIFVMHFPAMLKTFQTTATAIYNGIISFNKTVDATKSCITYLLFSIHNFKIWYSDYDKITCELSHDRHYPVLQHMQGLISVGTVGNAAPILIFRWERRSHTYSYFPVGT